MIARIRLFSVGRAILLSGVAATLAGFAWLLSAQDTTPPGFRAYRLQHAQAADIVPQLDNMLSGQGSRFEIVVDRSGNRILVRGDDDTQRLSAELIEAMDQTPAKPRLPQATAMPSVVRSYQVETGQLDRTLDELRETFPPATGARIAGDPRTSQLLVVAAEETQNRIAQALQSSGAPTKPSSAPSPDQTSRGAKLQHISSRDLENSLVRLLGGRVTRAATSDGQAAVFSVASATGLQPVLQVNRQENSVSYLGTADSVRMWQRVVQALDRRQDAADQQTDMVQLERADPQKVQRAVILMQTGLTAADVPTAKLASTTAPQEPAAAPASPAPAAPPPGAAPPAAAAPGDAASAAEAAALADEGGLIGPVQIEYIEGLDAMVIRGHKRDVERVKKIIADIEASSAETEPAIEIVELKNVGCQVLTTLITTVYNDILSTRQGRVNIQALVKPNAIMLIGRPESVEKVKELIAKLDQPSKPEAQFEVFSLKHISANDARETIQSFFVDRLGQTTQQQTAAATTGTSRPGLGTRVNVVADYRTNSLIVQASPTDMEEVRRMIAKLDIESAAAANELKIFRLKNALASDIGPVLQDALNWQLVGSRVPLGATRTSTFGVGQTFGQQEERARIRSAILSFMTVDAKGGKVLESGLLADVRITVDTNSNALVVTAPAKSMGLIEALINELDRLPNASAQIKVFTIVNGDATRLSTMLNQLLGQQTTTQTTAGTLFGQGTLSPFLTSGMQSAAASGESTLVPVRFGVDQRTNSIIATGSEGDLGVVEAILMRLDEQSLREHKTMVYWLANVPAENVAQALSSWIQSRTTLFQQQLQISPESPDIQWNRRVIVVPETISNTIIISAAPELFDEVKHVVESLDRRPPLIKIDVLIAEITLGYDFEFGTEFGLQDALLFDRKSFTTTGDTGANGPGFNFNNKPLGDTTTGNPANLLGQGLSSFGLGRISPTLGYGGLVLSASSDAVSALLRALEAEGRAQILSRPQVTTLDSQPATVNVGQITARPGDISQNANTTNQAVVDTQVGLVLGVTPRVTPDGLIIMEVDAEKSRLGDAGDSVTINGNVIPNINNVTASTTVSAWSGQTVVFAGLIETTKNHAVRGIPFISDIPILGRLFEYTTESDVRRELLIILTPHIIRNDDDIDKIRYAESERMSWCLSDVMALYGDVGMTSRPGDWCTCVSDVPTIFPDANPTGLETVPAPLPAGDGRFQPMLPSPEHTGGPRTGELEPSESPAGAFRAVEPVSNTGYQPWPPAMGYPGAMLLYDGTGQPSQAQPVGPYPSGPPAAGTDPYTSARRLPQGP